MCENFRKFIVRKNCKIGAVNWINHLSNILTRLEGGKKFSHMCEISGYTYSSTEIRLYVCANTVFAHTYTLISVDEYVYSKFITYFVT